MFLSQNLTLESQPGEQYQEIHEEKTLFSSREAALRQSSQRYICAPVIDLILST